MQIIPNLKLLLEILLILLPCVVQAEDADCIFNVTNSETERNLPVPLYNTSSDYTFAIPHKGSIYLRAGENITLLCSGTRNYVKQTNSNVTTVKCIENDEVKLYRNLFRFEQIQCKKIVRGDARQTKRKCGNNRGRIFQIGYPVTRTDWITLITVCHDPENGNTLYTQHNIYGKEIKFASKTKYRPQFSTAMNTDNEYETTAVPLAYNQAHQKSIFSDILGSSELANKYINEKSFLAKGHLSPDADFLLATAQFATYHYINVAPQWQTINGASWKSVEFAVRELSALQGNFDIYTGTHDVLSYDDKQVFLGENKTLPVPKYFWKIAYNPESRKAAVFIIINDPYIDSPKEEVFCLDICEESGFTKKSWKEPSSGYVFCCNYRDFHDIVKNAPKLRVSGVLTIDSENSSNPLTSNDI